MRLRQILDCLRMLISVRGCNVSLGLPRNCDPARYLRMFELPVAAPDGGEMIVRGHVRQMNPLTHVAEPCGTTQIWLSSETFAMCS